MPGGRRHSRAGAVLLEHRLRASHENNVNTLVTVELNPRGDETELVLTHERLPTQAIHAGHTRGWETILDHLVDAVSNDP